MIEKIKYDISREPDLEARDDAIVIQPILAPWWKRKYMLGLVVILIGALLTGFLITSSSSSSCPEAKPEELEFQYLHEDDKHIDWTRNGAPHGSACEDLPNDILSMTRGIDITKLDIFPTTVEGLRNNPGFARQVVKLTCNYNYVKRDPNGIALVRLPDQVKPTGYEIVSGLVVSKEVSRHTEKHTLDVKTQMAADVGISAFKLGMFSASASYKEKRNSFISKKTSFNESKISHLVRRIDFSKRSSTTVLDPHDDFQALLEKLPSDFSANPNGYLEVIRQFGTHYFISAQFGGFIQNSTEYTEGAQDSANSTQFDASANADVKLKLVVAHVGVSGVHSHNESQNQASQATFTKKLVYGGSIPLGYSGDLGKWIESVEKSPTLFSGRLVPISTLIQDDAKAKAVDLGTQVFLGQAYVKDLRETLQIAKEHRQGTDLTEINEMLKSLKNQSIQVLANPEILEALEQQVTALINSAPIPISTVHRRGFATIRVIEATLPPAKFLRFSRDAYVETRIGKLNNPGVAIKTNTTRIVYNNNHPIWNQEFTVPMELDGTVEFCVYDKGYLLTARKVEKMGCSNPNNMTIREIVLHKKLNDTPMRAIGFTGYYAHKMELIVQVAWYQREFLVQSPTSTETSK